MHSGLHAIPTSRLGPVHLEQDELARIPQLVGEVAIAGDPVQGQVEVLTWPGAYRQLRSNTLLRN